MSSQEDFLNELASKQMPKDIAREDTMRYVKIAAISLLFIGGIVLIFYLFSLKDKCISSSNCKKLDLPYCNHTTGKCEVEPENIAPHCNSPCTLPMICQGSTCVRPKINCTDCLTTQFCNTTTGQCTDIPSTCASTCRAPSTCNLGVCTAPP